jgi:hypothetical protein
MNTKKAAAKLVSTAIVVLMPIGALSATASASQEHLVSRSVTNAWTNRVSGLPSGGAALFDGIPLYGGSAFYDVGAAAAPVKPFTPNAWASRLSGLPGGGAALYS